MADAVLRVDAVRAIFSQERYKIQKSEIESEISTQHNYVNV
jgi:hypothetical protein